MDGLQRLLDFTSHLKESRTIHRLEQVSADEMMVTSATVGPRIEVYFTPEDATSSILTGDESVLDDMDEVKRLVDDFRDS